MTNPSSLVYINAQSQLPNGVNVAAGSLVTIALASIQGVYAWSVECIGTDDLSTAAAINASLTVNSASFTATFTMPNNDGYGAALIFRSVVNNGIDINNLVQPYLSTTFGVYTPVVGGIRVGAQNETVEGNSTYGWLTKFNEAIRSAVTTSVTFSNDLSGTQTFQTVVGLQNRPVVSTAPTSGQALEWNGSAWAPATISGSPTGPAGGDLSGSYPNPTISGLAVSKLAGGTNGYVLETVSGVPTWQPAPITFTAGGDLSGTSSSQEVIGILNQPLPSLADGYLFYNGSSWVFQTLSVPTTLPPSGSAGGALSGFYPNPTISLTSNSSITGTLPAANQANQSITLTGDATSSGGTTSSAATSVVALRGKSLDSSLSSIGSVQDGYVLTWVNGSSDWQAKPTATTVTSLPMSGDVTGTTNANTISNLAVSKLAAGTNGYVLETVSGVPTWQPAPVTFTAGGDLSGTNSSQEVVGLLNKTLPSLADGYLLYNGFNWVFQTLSIPTSLPPNGSAGGALSGSYPNPTISLTSNSSITGTLPAANQAVQSMGGDVSGTTASATVIGISGQPLPSLPVSDGYLNYTGSAWQFSAITIPTTLPPSGTAGGDLTGTYPNPYVVSAQGGEILFNAVNNIEFAVATSNVTINQANNNTSGATGANFTINAQNAVGGGGSVGGSLYLQSGKGDSSLYDGTIYLNTGRTTAIQIENNETLFNSAANYFTAYGTGIAHFNSSGLLSSSTIVNSDISATAAIDVSKLAHGTANQILLTNNAATATTWVTLSGDVNITASGAAHVTSINGVSVPTGTSANIGNVLQISGSYAASYAAINLAGGSDYVTGTLPAANQAAQSMGGDVSGTTAAATVVGISGKTLPSLPVSDGYLNYTGSAWQYSAITIPTSLPPNGSASGDLSGSYPGPTVSALRGKTLDSSLSSLGAAQDGYALTWHNASSSWQALPESGGGITQLIGDVTAGPGSGSQTATISNLAVSKLAAGTAGQVLLNNSTPTPTWTSLSSDVTISATGATTVNSISGSSPINISAGTLNFTSSSATITQSNTSTGAGGDLYINGQPSSHGGSIGGGVVVEPGLGPAGYGSVYLRGNGGDIQLTLSNTNYQFNSISTGIAHFDSSGNLSSSLISVGTDITAGTANQVLINNATPTPAWTTLSGDVTNSLGVMTVGGIKGHTLPSLPVSDGYLHYTGSAWQFSAITIPTSLPPSGAAGGALSGSYPNPTISLTANSSITGTLPTANQVNQSITLTGDVTSSGGTTGGATTVSAALRGKTLANSLSSIGASQDGYVLTWSNSSGYWYAAASTGGGGGGGSFTAGGDLTGSSSLQYVASLSGTGGSGGTITINGNSLTFGASQTSAAIQQTTLTSASNSANLTIQAQGNSNSGSYNAGTLNLYGGDISGAGGGAGGNIVIASGVSNSAYNSGTITLQIAKSGAAVPIFVASGPSDISHVYGKLTISSGVHIVNNNLDGYALPSPASAASGNVLTYSSGSIGWSAPTTPTIYSFTPNSVTKTSSFTIDSGTHPDYQILVNGSGITITLPAPTTGRQLVIKDISGSAETNNITIAQHSSEKIEGVAASYLLATNWGVIRLSSDGTDWYKV